MQIWQRRNKQSYQSIKLAIFHEIHSHSIIRSFGVKSPLSPNTINYLSSQVFFKYAPTQWHAIAITSRSRTRRNTQPPDQKRKSSTNNKKKKINIASLPRGPLRLNFTVYKKEESPPYPILQWSESWLFSPRNLEMHFIESQTSSLHPCMRWRWKQAFRYAI